MTLGEKVHLLRRRRGWTLRALGAQAALSHNTLARLERGEIPNPGVEALVRLARALDTSTDYLLSHVCQAPSGTASNPETARR